MVEIKPYVNKITASIAADVMAPSHDIHVQPKSCMLGSLKGKSIVSLSFPMMYPQITACTANVHTLPLVGTSTQVTLVLLVVVGQMPQFDAKIL